MSHLKRDELKTIHLLQNLGEPVCRFCGWEKDGSSEWQRNVLNIFNGGSAMAVDEAYPRSIFPALRWEWDVHLGMVESWSQPK